jgi:intracellular sulfur oxidation DsrE/DsrF family protein
MKKIRALGLACMALGWAGLAHANPSMMKSFKFDEPSYLQPHPFAKAHVVIQVDQDNPQRWGLALNNVQNMLDYMGSDKIQIIVVGFGPGLKMLLAHSPDAKRIESMAAEGVEFDACHNTMTAMARKLGHMPVLLPQPVIVPAGVIRIVQLEQHGFAYIKP